MKAIWSSGRLVIWLFGCCTFAVVSGAVVAGVQSSPDVQVRTSLDRTAMWIGDRVTYTIEIDCKGGFDVLDEDLARDRLKLEGLEMVSSDAAQSIGADGTTIHRYRYFVTTYRTGGPAGQPGPGLRIEPLTVRYFVKRSGQRLQDSAPAGEVAVPGAVIALRSMLPDDQETAALRDDQAATKRPALLALAQPIGLGLVLASIVPVVFWTVGMANKAGRRMLRRSPRQVRHDERESLEAIRGLDLDTAECRREVYSRLNALVREHLRDVAGIAGLSVTPGEVAPALSRKNGQVPAEVAASLLAACEAARYAPPAALPSADACRAALEQAEQVLTAR